MKLTHLPHLAKPEKHKYVRLIEFSLGQSSFAPIDACGAIGLTEKEFQFIAPTIYILNANQGERIRAKETQAWVLKPEAYFSYLQFVEFCFAVEASKRAYWLSIGALVLAIIGVVIAIK